MSLLENQMVDLIVMGLDYLGPHSVIFLELFFSLKQVFIIVYFIYLLLNRS